MLTLRFVRSICVCTLWSAAWAGAANLEQNQPQAVMLALDDGATLQTCQSFHWKAAPGASGYWLAVGNYSGGADLFNQDVSGRLSAYVKLPSDGRPVYVTLFTRTGAGWLQAAYRYRAPVGETPEHCGPSFQQQVGIYHWAGLGARSVSEGVDRIRRIGGHAVRLTLSARYYSDYNLAAGCYDDFTLSAVAAEPDVAGALADPAIAFYMITAYDGVTFSDCQTSRFLNPDFYTPSNVARIEEEYAAFTYQLYELGAGTGKRFLISNWEGDNAVYCGAAYRYAMDQPFQSWCDENYAFLYAGNSGPAESLEGLRLWFTARWRGIEEGKRRAAAAGLRDVAVFTAPEFSIVRALHDHGLGSVLYDVVPNVPFDYVSYSAYESINRPDAARELRKDLDTIREVAGTDAVVLGEVGFSRSVWGSETAARTQTVVETALDWGVSYVFQWALYDHSAEVDFGLCDPQGRETSVGLYYRSRYGAGARQPARR